MAKLGRLIQSLKPNSSITVRDRLYSILARGDDRGGLSQEAFADVCGLHRTDISGIERGVRNPTVIILDKIARALKVPAGQVLEEVAAPGKRR